VSETLYCSILDITQSRITSEEVHDFADLLPPAPMASSSPPPPRRKAVLFVLIDGLSDVTLRQLGDRTTLQAARTPAMDAIARAFFLTSP
jgi:hypothetical protein